MDPDQDSPIARAGRTFLTLWVYITEAVSRFLRPEPPATEINDNISHDATDNNEHLDHGHTNNGTTQESEEEPQRVFPASSVSLSGPVVSWDAGSELEIKNNQDDDKTYNEDESMIEQQVKTGIDVASLPVTENATEDKKEECLKLYADAMVLKIFEDVNNRSHPGESLNADIEEANNAMTVLQQNNEKIILESQNIAMAESSEGNLSLTFPETKHHSESKMFDDNCGIVSEGELIINKQECAMEDTSVESAKNKTKVDEKEDAMEQNISEGYNNAREESDGADTIEEDKEQDDTTFLFPGTMSEKPDLDDEDEGISNDDELSRLPSEQEESCMERHCLGSSATIKQEGSAQEEATVFKNTTPAKCEGQDFVELYSSYKESREGGPEHNNESDGSATQRFLEVENCKEVQTTLLQEEVESGEARRLQNSGSEAKGDSFEQTELMEKEEAMKDSLEVDIAGNQTNPILQDMKTVTEDKEFEVNFVAHEEEETNNEILVDFVMGEGLCEAVAERDDGGQFVRMTGFTKGTDDFLAFLDQTTDENDLPKTLPQTSIETEGESLTVNLKYTGLDLKDIGGDLCALETEIVEQKTTNESELQLEITAEDDKIVSCEDESLDVGNYETSASMKSNKRAIKDTYMLEQLTEPSCTEVIDDEILDLWIEQTSIDNTNLKRDAQDEMQPEMLDDEKVESILDQSIVCDANALLSTTTESGFFDQPLDLWGSHELPKMELMSTISTTVMSESEDAREFSITESEFKMPWKEDMLSKHLSQGLEAESTEAETLQGFDSAVPMSSPVMNSKVGVDADEKPLTKMTILFEVETMSNNQPDTSDEIQNTVLMSDTPAEDLVTYGYQLPLQEKPKEEAKAEFKIEEDKDIYKVDDTDLDFTPQKSRIAVKNPRARPPKDPRSLLHKISLEPSPSKPLNIPAGVPLGFKLPGLGAGFPVLKKTKKAVEHETETTTQETKPEENDTDGAKQIDSQHKPKWMPPGHPGFGNPLMSELKSKLKKTTKE